MSHAISGANRSNVLEELNASSIVVPGHGPVAKYQDLADFVAMPTTIRERMSALIKSCATVEQVSAAKITAGWDAKKGDRRSPFVRRGCDRSPGRTGAGGHA